MTAPLLTRLLLVVLKAVATLVGAALLLLVGLELVPGSPADLVPDAAIASHLEARWGLDRPVLARAASWFGRVATGDLGTSFAYRPGASVLEVLATPLQRTGLLLALAIPVSLGLARTPRRLLPVVVVISALPVFLLAHVWVGGVNAVVWSAVEGGYLARPAWFALPVEDHPVRTVLAALVLGIGSGVAGGLALDVSEVRRQRDQSDFAAVARVHGTPGPGLRHAILDALPLFLGRLPLWLGGCVILERVFLINGAGWVFWEACLLRDFELAMALALLAAAWVALGQAIGDSARIALDPRTRELP